MPQKPDKFTPALYGGIIIGVLSGIPFLNLVNCLCCAGILFGGFMSVYFYKNNLTEEMDPLTSGETVGLGVFAGVFGAVFSSLLSRLLIFLFGDVMQEMILGFLKSSGFLDSMTPEIRMKMSQPDPGSLITNIVAHFIICPLFGLLGGLIGYAVFRKRDKNEAQQA
jgi:hypothetical protein